MPTANVLLLARDLDLAIDQRDDRVVIRDASGVEWHVANRSVLLEGPQGSRSLDSPAVIAAGNVFLPLTSIAELAGRKLVVDRSRAMLLPITAVRSLAAARTDWMGPLSNQEDRGRTGRDAASRRHGRRRRSAAGARVAAAGARVAVARRRARHRAGIERRRRCRRVRIGGRHSDQFQCFSHRTARMACSSATAG